MKLTDIDLTDREQIAAAHALLAVILGNIVTPAVKAYPPLAPEDHPSFGQPSASEVFGGTPLPSLTNAAAVFGGNPPPLAPAVAAAGLPASAAPQTLPGVAGAPTAPSPAVPAAYIAPAVQAQVLASVTPTVERDKHGLPWDERIHAGTKTKNTDGAWKKKKNVNEATVASVEAQLRAMPQSAAPLPPSLPQSVPPTLPGVPPQPPAALPPSASALPGVPSGVPLAPSVPVPGMPGGSTASGPDTFEALMIRITAATANGLLPTTATSAACAAVGLPNIMALEQNPAFVPIVWQTLKASYPGLM